MATKGSYSLWGDNAQNETALRARSGDIYQQRNDERSVDSTADVDVTDRGQWSNKAEFILSCVGLSVGLGNVWRFPYLAYENGGAAFLIAYLILQLLIGKPMYFMELAVGQFSGKGPTGIWHMNPSAKGIGIAMAVISLDVAIFYNVIMAYTLYYFFSSMQTTLPWTVCKEDWDNCVSTRVAPAPLCTGNSSYDLSLDSCRCTGNYSFDSFLSVNCTNLTYTGKPTTASEYFFKRDVIQQSSGLEPENIGYPSWQLLLCLILSWIIVVLCLIKGVKSSGKVVYFTATFPYLILIILLIRGCLLEGAVDGILYFIVPKWDKLRDLKVWSAAAGQMFFSLSVSFGGIIMFGSYNKFRNNVYADALFISMMDLVTSIIAGFVIFTTFGGMAHRAGTNVTEVAQAGFGLAFVAYPEALSNFPVPQLWSVIFFFMLFTLGLDSEFGLLETVLTCICDEFPVMRKYRGRLCVGLGVICFLLALPCICPGGNFVVDIMANYGADFSVLVVATCECIAIMWVYGVMRFLKDVEYMLGKKPWLWPYWVYCWAFVAPIGITLLFVYRMVKYKPLIYPSGEAFPVYAQVIAWLLCALVLSPIPATFIYQFWKAKGDFKERMRIITTPTSQWQPQNGTDRNALTPDHFEMDSKHGLSNPGHDSFQNI